MPTPVYIVLCLLVPVLWALISARLFDWWQARRADTDEARPTGASGHSSPPAATVVTEPDGPDMYYI
jgi:hypothetical protein